MNKEKEVYVVKKCIYWDRKLGNVEGVQVETKEGNASFWINYWLKRLKVKTAQQYAYKLVAFLNFISSAGKNYLSATKGDLNRFLLDLRFAKEDGMFAIDSSSARHTTIRSYVTAITNFYIFLDNCGEEFEMPLVKETKNTDKHAYLYNISWTSENKKILVDKYLERYKAKKQYIKWYEEEEINALRSNLKTYRDKAIFELTLCGMRIDEVLSLRVIDYNSSNASVTAYRSKGKTTGDTGRVVALTKTAVKTLENYLTYERIQVENELMNQGMIIAEEIFVNMRHDLYFGEKLEYRNYLDILKRAAERGGIDPKSIRTHSGRSTAVMNDILFHAEHPELLTLDDIRIKYGWSQMTSMDPYLDTSNPKITMQNRKLLDKVRNEYRERYERETDGM